MVPLVVLPMEGRVVREVRLGGWHNSEERLSNTSVNKER